MRSKTCVKEAVGLFARRLQAEKYGRFLEERTSRKRKMSAYRL